MRLSRLRGRAIDERGGATTGGGYQAVRYNSAGPVVAGVPRLHRQQDNQCQRNRSRCGSSSTGSVRRQQNRVLHHGALQCWIERRHVVTRCKKAGTIGRIGSCRCDRPVSSSADGWSGRTSAAPPSPMAWRPPGPPMKRRLSEQRDEAMRGSSSLPPLVCDQSPIHACATLTRGGLP